MPPHHFTARAFAKINLGLKIVARRPDGFHELRTVFQTISLADAIDLRITPGRGVALTLAGIPCPGGSDNLAFRAAQLAAEQFALRGRIEIDLCKRIPLGAGLGGGSSDAATILRMLARAARRPPRLNELLPLARSLGSDVPLFLLGGTVLGFGRGDEVYALPDLAPWQCVLAMPRVATQEGLSTPAAFARWDMENPTSAAPGWGYGPPTAARAEAGRAVKPRRGPRQGLTEQVHSSTLMEFCSLVDQVLPAFRTLRNRGSQEPKVHAGIENDFLPGVLSLSLDFSRIHQQLSRASSAWVGLTGSGAAQFGLFDRAAVAAVVAARLARRHTSWHTRFVSRHIVQASVRDNK